MNITKKPSSSSAIAAFHKACKDLANRVNEHLFEGCRDWYWVGDEIGGLCDFNDTDFLKPEEMVLILEKEISYDDYAEWRDANIKYGDTKGHINLQSWIMGCRHSMLADKTRSSSANIGKK